MLTRGFIVGHEKQTVAVTRCSVHGLIRVAFLAPGACLAARDIYRS